MPLYNMPSNKAVECCTSEIIYRPFSEIPGLPTGLFGGARAGLLRYCHCKTPTNNAKAAIKDDIKYIFKYTNASRSEPFDYQ
jgi:hypothetical protein